MAVANRSYLDRSSSFRLWPLVWPFLAVLAALILLTVLTMEVLSGVRAYVTGESLWSKAQKQAVYSLTRYAENGREQHYERYLAALSVPLGDRQARLELLSDDPDMAVARQGFLMARNHPADVDSLINLFRWFNHLDGVRRAVAIWEEAEKGIDELQDLALQVRAERQQQAPDKKRLEQLIRQIRLVDERLTPLEENFSHAMGDAGRKAQIWMLSLMATVTVLLTVAALALTKRALRRRELAEQALLESEERYALAMRGSNDGLWDWNISRQEVYYSPRFKELLGYDEPEFAGVMESFERSLHPADEERVIGEIRRHVLEEAPLDVECRLRLRGGDYRWFRVRGQTVRDEHGAALRMAGSIRDITSLREIRSQLFEEKERLQVTLASIADAVIATDTRSRITFINGAAEELTGWLNADAQGQTLDAVFRTLDPVSRLPTPSLLTVVGSQVKATRAARSSELARRDGSTVSIEDSCAPIHDREGNVIGLVVVFRDVTERRRVAMQLAHQAQHDPLTDLPNRLLLLDRFHQAKANALRYRKTMALLYLDLDRFKSINDSLGHLTGDLLLKAVAERLLNAVRETDTVCRQGGDEFIVLLAEIESADNAHEVARKLQAVLSRPYQINGHELNLTPSIGISLYPEHGEDAETLIKHADVAMYYAKHQGRNTYQLFERELNASADQRLQLENGLRRAIERQELQLYYQPRVNLATGEIEGAEALIRWQHPERGFVPPTLFIPIAEEAGLVAELGEWVVREACRQNLAWQDQGLNSIPVSVNFSPVQLRRPSFLADLTRTIQQSGLDPACLEVELTEGAVVENVQGAVEVMRAMREIGIKIAIDDFGTGYSSLSYLKMLPVHVLKIDQSFVRDLTVDPDDAAIVRAVIAMAHSLKLKVTAEGVETQEQLVLLREWNCDQIQGFLVSEPLPADEFVSFLQRQPELIVL